MRPPLRMGDREEQGGRVLGVQTEPLTRAGWEPVATATAQRTQSFPRAGPRAQPHPYISTRGLWICTAP